MIKRVRMKGYNYNFNTETGDFVRWGNSIDEDAVYSPIGPELVDIEISTVCHGINGKPCSYCYKSNGGVGKNMDLGTFIKIFNHLPKNVGQIAFGIGDVDGNPDMIPIFAHCRRNGVMPNVTINGDRLSNPMVTALASLCGAVAVSNHGNRDVCYGAVKRLTDAGLKQVNIHQVVSKGTLNQCHDLIDDMNIDERLANMRAVVFLSLKRVGRGIHSESVTEDEFKELVSHAMRASVNFGFDSCSCNKFTNMIKDTYPELVQFAEPCESTLFSIYIDVNGDVYPCSFTALSFLKCGNAIESPIMDIWEGKICKGFRSLLEETDRSCPLHEV